MSELTTDHVEPTDGGLVVDAPSGTSEIRIERTFLRDRLGAWGADHTFTLTNGRIVAEAGEVTFTSFRPNATPTYTLGSMDSIRFLERPMWLSVEGNEEGSFNVTADAEDTTGQAVRVDASWLWDRGIYAPRVVHEDGFTVPVEWVEGGAAYRAGVPHFSEVKWEITGVDVSPELDVKIRVDGVLSDHTGDETWDAENRTLYIDIGDYLTEIDVLVERTWVDDHIDHLAVWERNVTNESIDGTEYYVSTFAADETSLDTVHVLREYQASDMWMWTQGNLSTVTTFGRPAFVRVTSPAPGRLNVTTAPAHVNETTLPYSVGVNLTLLSESGVDAPEVYDGDNETVGSLAIGSGIMQAIVDPKQANPTVRSFRNTTAPAFETSETSNHRCPSSYRDLASWEHDENADGAKEGTSTADAYVSNKRFCWQWTLVPGDDLLAGDISHYQVGGAAAWLNGTANCDINVVAGDQVEMEQGSARCEWNGTLPPDVLVNFGAHSFEEPPSAGEVAYWYARKVHREVTWVCVDWVMQQPALVIYVTAPEPTTKKILIGCAAVWATDAALELWVDDEDRHAPNDEDDEAIITHANRTVNVSSTTRVNLVDTNSDREDTWDALEDNDDVVDIHELLDYPNGSQTIEWEIHNVRNASLNSSHDLSHVDKLSDATRNNDAYRLTDWEPGWTGLRADARKTDFNTTVDLTSVDWEAPEPVDPNEVTLGCDNDWVTVAVVDIDPPDPPDPDDPWIQWELVDHQGLDADSLSSQGNLTTGEVGEWGSMAQAWANDTTTNTTFAQNTCGGYESHLLEDLLESEYASTMTAKSKGYDPHRGKDVEAEDLEELIIVFKIVPHAIL